MRVFHDRLINENDRKYLIDLLKKQFVKFPSVDIDQILDTERIIFADFLNGKDVEPKYYQQVKELQLLLNKLDSF